MHPILLVNISGMFMLFQNPPRSNQSSAQLKVSQTQETRIVAKQRARLVKLIKHFEIETNCATEGLLVDCLKQK